MGEILHRQFSITYCIQKDANMFDKIVENAYFLLKKAQYPMLWC